MKSRILFFFCLVLIFSTLKASDTTSSVVVTPGVIHTQITLPGPYTLNLLEIDIKNPYLTIESYRPNGLTKTSVQAAANDKPDHRVIGAVNAGFFSFETGWPVYNQVANGVPVLGVATIKSAFAMTKEKKIGIDGFSFTATLFDKHSLSLSLNGCNTDRGSGQTILYSPFKGSSTGTDQSGSEISLAVISSPVTMNDTLVCVVSGKAAGNSSIPSNGYVVSASSGSSAAFLNSNAAVADTVKLVIQYLSQSGISLRNITQLISGYGRIVKDGVPFPAIGEFDNAGTGFTDIRNPRTFLGINADTSKVYFCTVDGRQASSIGMTFAEMANFLISIGVTNAFNLDGGGSTTMVVRGEVVNAPSDPGGERSVANSLQLISTAPVGTLHSLNIVESQIDVFQGKMYQFHAEGKDEFYNPLPLPGTTAWTCDSSIGTIDSQGLFTAKNTNDSGWVRCSDGAIIDSALVHVRVITQLAVFPPVLVMVPGERLTLSVRGIDSGNNPTELQNDQVSYQVNGSNINVDQQGVVTSTGFASGSITVHLDTVTRTISYSSTGNDTAVSVDAFNDLHFWSWNVENTDPDNVFFDLSSDPVVPSPPAFRIRLAAPPASTVILNTTLPISGRPDSIRVKVYGDGGGHSAKLFIRDKDNEEFVMNASTAVTWNNEWKNLVFRLVTAAPVASGNIDYPVSIERIELTVGSSNLIGGKSTDTLYVDDVSVHYPDRKVTPQILFDFNSNINGWQQPSQNSAAQTIGINIPASTLALSTEHPYEGSGCGKWTFVDDPNNSADWDVRITRTSSSELGSMLRGSYIGAWIWSDGNQHITLRTVIRDGNGQLCQGPAFPVNHVGWKLIGTRLDPALFSPYLTSGTITETNNRFNGFRLQALNADVNGKTKIFFIDKMVTSALTVPSGFSDFGAVFDSVSGEVTLRWGVNSEISINRYEIEKSTDGVMYAVIGSVNAVGNTDTTARYKFTDPAEISSTVYYMISQITNDGAIEYTPVIHYTVAGVAGGPAAANRYSLDQNYPNPFNPSTRISFSIASKENVRMQVFDLLGRKVTTLIDEILDAGDHSTTWNALNVASGIYFYRLETPRYTSAKKMIVMK